MKKIKSNKYLSLLLVIAILVSTSSFFVIDSHGAMTGGTFVTINYTGQVMDSITYNGVTVNAVYPKYKPSDTDPEYNCAAFVTKFYQQVYGYGVYNMWSVSSTPTIGNGHFYSVNSPQVGDIIRFNVSVHWAIVKNVDSNGTVTVIQQNARSSDQTKAWVGALLFANDSSVTYFRYSNASAPVKPSTPINLRTHTGATSFLTTDTITFHWNASSGATEYWYYMYKDGTEIYYGCSGTNTSFTSAPTSAGNYTLYVRAGNSAGYSTLSIGLSFTVSVPSSPPAPTNLRTHTGGTVFLTTESITFHWNASSGATEYWYYMYKDGTEIYYGCSGTNTSFTSAPTSAGNYTLYTRAGNGFGYSPLSQGFSFTVVIPSPPPVPTNVRTHTGGSTFFTTESITFHWDASSGATEYWYYMYKDGVEIYYACSGTSTSFTAAPTSAGQYTLYTRAGNSLGYSALSHGLNFTVYNSAPSQASLSVQAEAVIIGQGQVFAFSANQPSSFTIGIDRWEDGRIIERVETKVVNSGYMRSFSSPGYYSAYVTAWNAFGGKDSQKVFFVVVAPDQMIYRIWDSEALIDETSGIISGLDPGIESLEGYIGASPGKRLVLTPSVYGFGTGTKVHVELSGEIEKSYVIVIFGDVNGDGNIDSNDEGMAIDYENWRVNWDPVTDAAFLMAGDLNGDGNIDSIDADLMAEVENWNMVIDQTTGLARLPD